MFLDLVNEYLQPMYYNYESIANFLLTTTIYIGEPQVYKCSLNLLTCLMDGYCNCLIYLMQIVSNKWLPLNIHSIILYTNKFDI